MAIIHVSEAEAARDLPGLLVRVRSGEHIHIDREGQTIAIVQPAPLNMPEKTLSAAIRWAEEQNSPLLLDDEFARDLEQVICNHEHEGLRNPWED